MHVCYAPEKETVEETVAKLFQRRKDVLTRLPNKTQQQEEKNKVILEQLDMSKLNRKRKHPALEITNERLKSLDPDQVWKGIPQQLDPRKEVNRFQTNVNEPKKHYQLNIVKPQYGPTENNYTTVTNHGTIENNESGNSDEDVKNKKPKLIPSTVVRNVQNETKKQILFHKKRKFDLV